MLMHSEKPKDCSNLPSAEASHPNTASLSRVGATLCCILPMGEPKGSHPLTLQSLHALRFDGGT